MYSNVLKQILLSFFFLFFCGGGALPDSVGYRNYKRCSPEVIPLKLAICYIKIKYLVTENF